MEKFKAISLQSRLRQNLCRDSFRLPVSLEKTEIFEQVAENGRITSKVRVKTIDPRDRVKGFKVLDFCLENVIASGAVDSLHIMQLSGGNIDSVESAVAFAEAKADAAAAAAAEAAEASES